MNTKHISQSFSFDFPEDTIDIFIGGLCGNLAELLSIKLSVQIYGVKEVATKQHLHPTSELQHYVVYYKGYFVDIRGLWKEKELLDNWKDMQVEISTRNSEYNYILVSVNSLKFDYNEDALLYADKIIDIISKKEL